MLVDDFLFNNSNQEHKHHANLNQLVPNYDREASNLCFEIMYQDTVSSFHLGLDIEQCSDLLILPYIASPESFLVHLVATCRFNAL